jgi:hypothetical protein
MTETDKEAFEKWFYSVTLVNPLHSHMSAWQAALEYCRDNAGFWGKATSLMKSERDNERKKLAIAVEALNRIKSCDCRYEDESEQCAPNAEEALSKIEGEE